MPDEARLPVPELRRLIDAVRKLPCMQDNQKRQMVVEELLSTDTGRAIDPSRTSHTWGLVRECLVRGIVVELVDIAAIEDDGTQELQELRNLVVELFPPQDAPTDDPGPRPPEIGLEDRWQLRDELSLVDSDHLAVIAAHPTMRHHVAFRRPAGSAEDVFDELEADGLGLHFLEVVAHTVGEVDVDAIHHYVESNRTDTDVEVLDELCRSLAETDPPLDGEPVQIVHPSPVLPAVWGGVPPRNKNFIGRVALLEELHDALAQDDRATLLPHSLYGLGGVGKSQTAVEYVYRYQLEYDLIWWIPSEDERSIRRSIVSLAKRLALTPSEDADDTIARALDVLRVGDPYRRWLVVFDNAPEPLIVHPYLPTGVGHVLITSRSRSWANEWRPIEVDVFAEQESLELLAAGWPELTGAPARQLSERLGHLPLALEQAVAVHVETGIGVEDYLAALEQQPANLLREGKPTGYPRSMAEALSVALASLEEVSPPAVLLLELCCVLGSQPISLPLLNRGRGEHMPPDVAAVLRDEVRFRRAIRELGRYALVKLDPARELLSIHNLVRDVIRDRMPDERRDLLSEAAHALLATANPGQPDNPDTWPFHGQIAPHVRPSGVIYSNADDARLLVLDQIRYLYAIGDYVSSSELGQEAIDNWSARAGADDQLTLVGSRHLANAMRALGRNDAARERNIRTLEAMTRTLGPMHEHTLATANSVAADLRIEGHLRQAYEQDVTNLRNHREVLGAADPASIRVLGNIAVDHRLLGDAAAARQTDEESIDLRIAVYGDDHPRTLFAYVSLARDLYGLGKYSAGLDLLDAKLPTYVAKMPPDHGDILVARRLRAMLLRKTGALPAALTEADATEMAHRARFGEFHEHTQSAQMTLGNCLRSSGQYERSVSVAETAQRGYQATFGENHPFTLSCASNVGIGLALVDRSASAVELIEATAASLASVLGEEHPYALCARHNLAILLSQVGRGSEAAELSRRVLEVSRRVRAEGHPTTYLCAANRALDLEASGEGREAGELKAWALNGLLTTLGSESPETVAVGLNRRVYQDIEVPVL